MRTYAFLAFCAPCCILMLSGCPAPEAVLDDIAFVWCPPGSFLMGRAPDELDSSPAEEPRHTVTFAEGFWISKFEITQREWNAILGDNPSAFGGLCNGNRPVDQVNWQDAQDFVAEANALLPGNNYALPSEAEWEYACRAGTTTRYYWGDDPDATRRTDYAWVPENSGAETHDVGQKLPNAWGIHDMAGNVWEWVQDRAHNNYIGAPSDGTAWEDSPVNSHRGVRGGSWYNAGGCRSAYRGFIGPEGRYGDYGLRLVMRPDAG